MCYKCWMSRAGGEVESSIITSSSKINYHQATFSTTWQDCSRVNATVLLPRDMILWEESEKEYKKPKYLSDL